MRTRLIAALLLVSGAAATAGAQGSPGVPTAVQSVVSASNLDHTLRVVVLTGGFEHVSSKVYFQWLVPDRDSQWGMRLVASVLVDEVSGGFYSVGSPVIEGSGEAFRVTLEATQTQLLKQEMFTFVTTSVGAYRSAK